MKRRIADWMFKFWYNNHTHLWEVYESTMHWKKCRHCGKISGTSPFAEK